MYEISIKSLIIPCMFPFFSFSLVVVVVPARCVFINIQSEDDNVKTRHYISVCHQVVSVKLGKVNQCVRCEYFIRRET